MPLSPSTIAASGTISPTYTSAVNAHPISISGSSIQEIRASRAAHLAKLRHLYPIPGPIPEVRETDHQVLLRDESEITVRVYEPVERKAGGSALVMAYHEGGWTMGDLSDEEMNCRMWVRDLGCVCVNVGYRYDLLSVPCVPQLANGHWALKGVAVH
jgi:acetyl esterase/lipase